MNSRAYNRDVSRRKALRKRRIAREIFTNWLTKDLYDNLHQYSKNKIHCDCPLCSAKTKNKGRRRHKHGNYAPSINYSISDIRKKMRMDNGEFEEEQEKA